MRIAMIVGKFPVLSETFILNQIHGLTARGHTVDVFTLYGTPDRTELEMCRPLNGTRLAVTHVPRASDRPAADSLRMFRAALRDPGQARRLWRLSCATVSGGRRETFLRGSAFLNRRPYDIVYCQFGSVALEILPFRSLPALSGKLAVAFRGADISSFLSEQEDGVYEGLFREADILLPNSKLFQQRLIELGCDPARCRLIRSGINLSGFPFQKRTSPGDGIVRFIFVGRLVAKKGVDDCLKAFRLVRESRDNFRFTIVGHGPLRREIDELIELLDLKPFVRTVGACPHDELPALLEAHHIFLSANKTPPCGDTEGVTNTIKEAAAAGLPVISTRHGAIPELIEEGVNGFLVEEGDIERLASRIMHCMDHPEMWAGFGARGRERVVSGYDSETWNNRLAEVFADILEN